MVAMESLMLKMAMVVIVVIVSEDVVLARQFRSTCETLPSDLHIVKDDFDANSILIRTCEANVAVNKCEGACASSIKPSALNSIGFQKECHCCRESGYRKRQLVLSSCYDSDGVRLDGHLGQMTVSVNEPIGCKCHECGHRP